MSDQSSRKLTNTKVLCLVLFGLVVGRDEIDQWAHGTTLRQINYMLEDIPNISSFILTTI